jgi:hypothetical protein
MCSWKFALNYVLGLREKPNHKAELGNMVHKALELLAHRRVCEQEGRAWFEEPEIGLAFRADRMTVEAAADFGFEHYKKKNESQHNWTESFREQVHHLTRHTVEFNDGMFSPLKRKVIAPEQYFDLPINEPWAYYDFKDPFTGNRIKGQLAIKGTVDLLTEGLTDVLEYLDWKTGARKNWATGDVKTYVKLRNDSQLLLYFYALSRLYPQYRYIFTTIFFCRDGGPYTLHFSREEDIPRALDMLKTNFEAIKNTQRPARIWDDPEERRRVCFSFCSYGKTKHPQSGKTLCTHYYQELQQLGMDRLMVKHGVAGAFGQYGSGGGSSNRD